MLSTFAISAAAFAGLSAAQSVAQQNYPYTIVPSSVPESTRDVWCINQKAQCPLICLQQPDVTSMTTNQNDCSAKDLTYACVCENGVAPNVTMYSQTLPFYICQQWGTQCVAGCNGDNTCSDSCRANHPCGAQSPYRGNASLSTSSSSTRAPTASGTSNRPATGFGDAGATASSAPAQPGAAPASFVSGAAVGMAAVFGSMVLGFAVLL